MNERLSLLLAWSAFFFLAARTAADDAPIAVGELRAAVQTAIPLLEKGAAGSMAERAGCFTCHNQGLPILALTKARQHGFEIDADHFQRQVQFAADFLARNRDDYLKGHGQGGQVATAGYALWALDAGGWEPDGTTQAVAEYLLLYQQDADHWEMTSHRPPTESSHFTANYLAIRGLKRFAAGEQIERAERRIAQVRQWLAATSPTETEDRVFRLWALRAVETGQDAWQAARDDLLKTQREDGGWAQTAELESDAYATATALAVLHEAGELPASDPVCQRGLRFLLSTQQGDGSWHVRSRSKPFQKYFESGFPHGPDQFISISATSWAVIALVHACPKAEEPVAER